MAVTEDQDEYDRKAVFFLGRLRAADPRERLMVGSARLIQGETENQFEFPCQKAFRFQLPRVVQDIPMSRHAEVGRVVSETPGGVIPGKLTTALGLVHCYSHLDPGGPVYWLTEESTPHSTDTVSICHRNGHHV